MATDHRGRNLHAGKRTNQESLSGDAMFNMVRGTSDKLMNSGKGPGIISNTWDDAKITAEFSGKTARQIANKVHKIESAHAEVWNDHLAASGEYDFPEGSQPVRKSYDY